MNLLKISAAYLLLFSLSSPVLAFWGPNGHRVIGEIAEKHLNNKARKAVHNILGNESLGMATNWADFIKSDSTMNYLGPWHYLNVKQGLNYEQFKQFLSTDSAVDAYTKLNFLVNELKNGQLDDAKKLMYLHLLIHISGDIHQPMHIGQTEDLGGNKIKVAWFNEQTNLHSIWDDKLIEFQKLSYTELASSIDFSTKAQRQEWQTQAREEWYYESYKIAGELYNEITQPDQKLGYRYNFDHINTLKLQLFKGGIRLAGLLNEIFGN